MQIMSIYMQQLGQIKRSELRLKLYQELNH